MNAQHTPGPWNFSHRKGDDGMYRTEVFSDEHGGIATCGWTPKHCGNGVTQTYREANARLIAAAPDLLQSLIEITGVLDALLLVKSEPEEGSIGGRARASIAKATGLSV